MSETETQANPSLSLAEPSVPSLTTFEQNYQRLRLVQKYYADGIMVEGEDYGTIPNMGKKPSLFKPGAEKLCVLFGLAPFVAVIERIEDWEGNFVSYEVKVTIRDIESKCVRAQGVGHCNSRERKYKNQQAADVANTVLKMAKKRGFIDAVLSATGASAIFTQDIEDMVGLDAPQQRAPAAQQQRPPQRPAGQPYQNRPQRQQQRPASQQPRPAQPQQPRPAPTQNGNGQRASVQQSAPAQAAPPRAPVVLADEVHREEYQQMRALALWLGVAEPPRELPERISKSNLALWLEKCEEAVRVRCEERAITITEATQTMDEDLARQADEEEAEERELQVAGSSAEEVGTDGAAS